MSVRALFVIFKLIVACLSCWLTSFAHAQHASFVISNESHPQSLGHFLNFYVDKSGNTSLEDAMRLTEWKDVSEDNIIGGFTDDVYWVRFTIENPSKEPFDWNLELDYPIIDFIEFYALNNENQYAVIKTGDQYPFHYRPIDNHNFVFPILSPPESTQTFYLRIKTESSMYISLNFLPKESLSESMNAKLLTFGSIYGIVFLASLYCLINAVFMRERMYLFIAIGIFGSMFYSLSINGFAFQFLWPNNLWLQGIAVPFFLNICFGFALMYNREFLDMHKVSPFFDKTIAGLSTACLITAVLSLFTPYSFVIRISTVFAIVMSVTAFLAGVVSYRHGNKSARYYLIGWFALFIGAITFALKSLGLVPANSFAIWGQEFGFACIAIFLTLAQSDHFFQAKKKHEAEQAFSLNAIKDAEKKYRSLFENALEGIFQMDLSGRLMNANKAFATIVGSDDIDMLLAHPHPPFSLSCLQSSELTKLKSLLDQENSLSNFEAKITLPSNEVRWVSIAIQKIQNKLGMPMHYEGAMTDITETQKRQHAEKQQRMAEASTEAKSLFLANMSHEIRTPMNAIIGFTDLALGKNDDPELTNYLKKIRVSSSNLLGIINDILDFSKIEAGKLEIESTPFSLQEVISNLKDIVSTNVESKGLALEIHVDDDIPDKLIGDPLRIGQVLLNLTNNAIKFTSKGKVSVELDLISLSKQDMSIHIIGKIKDTGIGIPEDKLRNLFTSFTQADDSTTRRFGGTGLGLSISKQLVGLMGGEISVKSKPDQGSTFIFTFSCKLQDRRQRNNPHFLNPQLPLKVLVVDDQSESRELVTKVLNSLGHQVITANHAHIAVQLIKKHQNQGSPFDMLLVDWLMPEVDGIQCCQLIQEDQGITNPRMILITGYDQSEAKEKAKQAGIDAYLLKPLKAQELEKTIETIFQDRRSTPHVPAQKVKIDFKTLSILLVEDVIMNQELATEILSKRGISVSIANHGQEAVDALHANKFDLVLMDMQMPVMDGCQATEVIRTFNSDIPIIAMTANAMTGDKNKCIAAGMNDYITKPINPEILFTTIAKWIGHSRGLQPATSPIFETNTLSSNSTFSQQSTPSPTTDSASRPNLNDASLNFLASLEADINFGDAPAQTNLETQDESFDTNTLSANTKTILSTHSQTFDGIDFNEGLNRCQENLKLYLKFLGDFKRDYRNSAIQLGELINSGKLAEVRALAHKIKGVASNLAAHQVANTAKEIELLSFSKPSEAEAYLSKYNEALTRCLESMDEILNKHEIIETEKPKDSLSLFQTNELSEKLSSLADLIQSQSLDALDTAAAYLDAWPIEEQKAQIQDLITALDNFDFEEANTITKKLISE